jgi:hypothetical protein
MSELEQLFDKHGCDKGSKHKYHTIYESIFEPLIDKEINILEVGVLNGESLKVWLDYFPNANIYGIDIFSRVAMEDVQVLNEERCQAIKGDSTNIATAQLVKKQWPDVKFDIIIDDALHVPEANAKTMHNFFPLLKENGMYCIEDVWPLDIMNSKEWNQYWIRKRPNAYNMLKWSVLAKELEGKAVTRYDNRKATGEGDSYIIIAK